jgi:hypothetical protein
VEGSKTSAIEATVSDFLHNGVKIESESSMIEDQSQSFLIKDRELSRVEKDGGRVAAVTAKSEH